MLPLTSRGLNLLPGGQGPRAALVVEIARSAYAHGRVERGPVKYTTCRRLGRLHQMGYQAFGALFRGGRWLGPGGRALVSAPRCAARAARRPVRCLHAWSCIRSIGPVSRCRPWRGLPAAPVFVACPPLALGERYLPPFLRVCAPLVASVNVGGRALEHV